MRIIGKQQRTEFILNIEEAMRIGTQLDQTLALASIPPRQGVRRMTHAQMNAEDLARSVQMAKRLNKNAT